MAGVFPPRARQLEFALAVIIIATVSAILIDRLHSLQEDAERLMVESTVRNINSGLMLHMATLVAAQRESELPGLAQKSPADWLERVPNDYREAPRCDHDLSPGAWCWEKPTKRLYYRPRLHDGLKIEGNMPFLVWTLRWPGAVSEIRPGALRMEPVQDYHWK